MYLTHLIFNSNFTKFSKLFQNVSRVEQKRLFTYLCPRSSDIIKIHFWLGSFFNFRFFVHFFCHQKLLIRECAHVKKLLYQWSSFYCSIYLYLDINLWTFLYKRGYLCYFIYQCSSKMAII